uniref:Uncharacterized protein n=1 Tax=Steinernema glaseri TaxID=37863 RepID=A0A1I7ZAL2_9BILA
MLAVFKPKIIDHRPALSRGRTAGRASVGVRASAEKRERIAVRDGARLQQPPQPLCCCCRAAAKTDLVVLVALFAFQPVRHFVVCVPEAPYCCVCYEPLLNRSRQSCLYSTRRLSRVFSSLSPSRSRAWSSSMKKPKMETLCRTSRGRSVQCLAPSTTSLKLGTTRAIRPMTKSSSRRCRRRFSASS